MCICIYIYIYSGTIEGCYANDSDACIRVLALAGLGVWSFRALRLLQVRLMELTALGFRTSGLQMPDPPTTDASGVLLRAH